MEKMEIKEVEEILDEPLNLKEKIDQFIEKQFDKINQMPPQSQEYARGYNDGYIAALNHISLILDESKKDIEIKELVDIEDLETEYSCRHCGCAIFAKYEKELEDAGWIYKNGWLCPVCNVFRNRR